MESLWYRTVYAKIAAHTTKKRSLRWINGRKDFTDTLRSFVTRLLHRRCKVFFCVIRTGRGGKQDAITISKINRKRPGGIYRHSNQPASGRRGDRTHWLNACTFGLLPQASSGRYLCVLACRARGSDHCDKRDFFCGEAAYVWMPKRENRHTFQHVYRSCIPQAGHRKRAFVADCRGSKGVWVRQYLDYRLRYGSLFIYCFWVYPKRKFYGI